MSESTNIESLFTYPYSLIKVNHEALEYYTGTAGRIVFQCHYPEEMLVQFSLIDDFEKKKAYYFVMDVRNVQLLSCYKNVAERELKRHIKGK